MTFALLALCALQPSPPAPSPAASSQPAPSRVEGSRDEGSRVQEPVTVAASIRNSGSTNTLPYTIAVTADGNAVVTLGSGAPEVHRLPAGLSAALFEELRAAAPLDALAPGHCMRSASFGTTTTVTFGAASSPDLSCAPDPAARELAGTVAAIVAALHLAVMRGYRAPAPQ